MHIWYRRPLFAVCTAFMAAAGFGWVYAGTDGGKRWLPALVCLAAALLCAAGAAALILPSKRGGAGSRPARARLLLTHLALLAAAAVAALGVSGAYFTRLGAVSARAFDVTDAPAVSASADGDAGEVETPVASVTVEGVVTACRGSGGQLTSYEMTIRKLNGTRVGSALLPCRAVLTCFYVSDLRPGHAVIMTACPVPLAEEAGDADTLRRLTGDGFVFALHSYSEDDWTLSAERDASLTAAVGAIRRTGAARLQTAVGRDAGGLPAALLLGERSFLDASVRRDFARAGVSHMLAISGLHVTLLFGLLLALCRLVRLPRRVSLAVVMVTTWAYLLLLGFPPSATRAVIMLSFVCLAGLFSVRSDPLTALGAAGLVILAVSPAAVCDDGFWMSFSAAFGLVTVMPLCTLRPVSGEGKPAHPARARAAGMIRKAAVGLLTGVAAMTCSLWITGQTVGQFSLASPLSTLLMTPLCAAALVLSLLTLPLCGTAAASVCLAPLLRLVCRAMTALAGLLGRPSWVVVPLRHPAVLPVTVGMMLLLLLLLGVKLPARARPAVLLPLVCGWLTLGIVLSASAVRSRDTVTLTCVSPSSVSDELVLTNRASAVILDISDGSHSALYAAQNAASDAGAVEIGAVIVTHYHSRLPGALRKVLSSSAVRTLLLPFPEDADDYYLMLSCLSAADGAGDTDVRLYAPGEVLTVFGGTTVTVQTAYVERSVQPIVAIRVDTGTDVVTYLGGAALESDLRPAAEAAFAGGTAVVCGRHGPTPREGFAPTVGERLSLVCFADPSDASLVSGLGNRAVCAESITIRMQMGAEKTQSGPAPAP